MAQHKLRSRIAQFKQPFLVGAVTSAALLGCGGISDGPSSNPDGLTGTQDACPDEMPPAGASCLGYSPGIDCDYDETSCTQRRSCTDGAWEDRSPACNPPHQLILDECPVEMPSAGASCDQYQTGLDCEYNSTGCTSSFYCADGTWQDQSPTCNPPPTLVDECPPEVPSADASCYGYEPGLDCEYNSESSCPTNVVCEDGTWLDRSPTCNPPPQLIDECPVETPASHQACDEYVSGLSCEYGVGTSCPTTIVCDGVTWESETPPCNPPPPELSSCPEQRPTVGTACDTYTRGLECEYAVDPALSCPEASLVTCGEAGYWEGPAAICNPPAPEPTTECPTDAPVVGDSCEGYQEGLVCGPEPTCEGGVGTRCGASGAWEAMVLACNPPPPETSAETDAGAVDGG